MSLQPDKHYPGQGSNRYIHNSIFAAMSLPSSNPVAPKRPSRSNSTSSSVTVKKTASLSSRSGPRTSFLRGRSTSPDSISRVLNSLNSSRQDPRGRPEVAESRKVVPALNGNRWSHSTSSSISGIDADLIRKRTSSSGATRRSIAAFNWNSNGFNVQDSIGTRTSSRNSSTKRASVGPSHIEGSRLNFQDSSNLNIVRDLSQPVNTAASAEYFQPTWEHRGVNKFGESVQGLSIQYTTDAVSQGHPNGALRSERSFSPNRPRHRDRSANRSKDISNHSIPSVKSDQSRGKGHRSPQQKDMLSKALARANTAVLLDNAQDVTGAIEAYNEACMLLEQVMIRSSDIEDRRKLAAIRTTYSNRIGELHDLDNSFADLLDKALPDEPVLDDFDHAEEFYHDDSSFHSRTSKEAVPTIQLPLRQESLLPQIFGGDEYLQHRPLTAPRDHVPNSQLHVPMEARYMPPPLSPRHPSPQPQEDGITPASTTSLEPPQLETAKERSGSTSWLENFDGSSTHSSSRLSSIDFGDQNGQLVSDIQAEFDAAMNAAVESAYADEINLETPRIVEKAMDTQPHGLVSQGMDLTSRSPDQTDDTSDLEAEEEERLLDEMTREFGLEGPGFDHQPKPVLPRQSNSSGFSSRTWGSSVASTAATSGTTLSTLAEGVEPSTSVPPPPAQSPPMVLSPVVSRQASQATRPSSMDKHVPIRDRRLSGQSASQLKIETFAHRSSVAQQPQPLPAAPPAIEEPRDELQSETSNNFPSFTSSFSSTQPLTPLTSIASGDSFRGDSPATPALTQGGSVDDNTSVPLSPLRAGRMMMPPPPLMRKNISSSSLKKGSLSINTSADLLESPITPGSAVFPGELRRRPSNTTPAVPTPGGSVLTAGAAGGLYLFDDYTSRSFDSRSGEVVPDETMPLEPCPDSFLLRPFWLMRSLYQALSQPHGGYVTQKLFIPRDIWRVRSVKIKALEDKISTCDFLTAALQKLAKVDTLDAGAVLEEVQSFEMILDQVRSTLSKKLGSDVGLAGTATVFRNSPAGDDPTESANLKTANASSAAKSIASGWRKLRSKSSSANLNSGSATRDTASHNYSLPSLPMTTSSSVATSRSHLNRARDPPPTPSQLPNIPPSHAAYMSSLARLFDAVQILDAIARQVEDPGLKYSSKTHVGLELSVRNAAEFFAFYIIRFVMSDLMMLVDKFLKRGTEWVVMT